MQYVIDLLALAIAAVSIYFAWRKGMIKTLFSLLGGVLAVVLALTMCSAVSAWLNEKYIGPAVRNTVLTAVNGSKLTATYDEALQSVDVVEKLQEMPDTLRAFLETLNVDVDQVVASAQKSKADSLAAREQLIDSIAVPISKALSNAAALILLVLVFFVLLYVVSRLLEAVFKVLPFGKSVNKAGGLVFGVLRAALLLIILGAVAHWLACGNILISRADLDRTVLVKAINQINPILTLIS